MSYSSSLCVCNAVYFIFEAKYIYFNIFYSLNDVLTYFVLFM